MRILYFFLFFLSSLFCLQAQLTIEITSIPNNTPSNAPIYLAGNFNDWNASHSDYIFTQNGNTYSITINPPSGMVEFKCTRGNWDSVEGTVNGDFVANRIFQYDGSPTTKRFSIAGWEDINSSGGGIKTTAANNVNILSSSFYIPELDRTRKIWIYLPPDYFFSTKDYPVLYMHDGQNVFDAYNSFSGEWGVDETLNELFYKGDYGCIVIAVANGESHRLEEYSPWNNPEYGGGEGDEYIEFVVNTLKPYIDSNYRTLPHREFTGMMGSSMGGLISMYAGIEFQETFGLLGIFSPAFWFAEQALFEHIDTEGKQDNVRMYFLSGANESASMVPLMQNAYNACIKEGFQSDELFFLVEQDGQHSEWFWRREFEDAYQWLFQPIMTQTHYPNEAPIKLFPNPVRQELSIQLPAHLSEVHIHCSTLKGQRLIHQNIVGSSTISLQDFPEGFVVVTLYDMQQNWLQTERILVVK